MNWGGRLMRGQGRNEYPNAWQGTLRFGWLDADLLGKTIADDLSIIAVPLN